MKYFLGLSSTYSAGDTFRHTFAFGNQYDLSELRAFLAARYGATYDHVAVYANGRTALTAALKATVKRGGKVVITSMTCYAVVQAVRSAGCVPIFADVDPNTLHYGKKELEKAISSETNVQAVIVQNNLGIPADIVGIEEVAKAHKLTIIEDLAHCVGVKYADGREAGTVGRATVLSFGKGKSVDVVTGGAVVLTDPLDSPISQPEDKPVFKERFRARFYPLFSAIIRGGYGLSTRFGKALTAGLVEIHAIKKSADGDVNLKLRPTYWQAKLALKKLQAIPRRGRKPLRDFYLVNDRDAILAELEKNGYIFHDVWYSMPVSPKRYYDKVDFHPEACPEAARIATQIVNVPTWYSREDLALALKIIKKDLLDENAISDAETEYSDPEKEKMESVKQKKRAIKKARKERHKKQKNKKLKTKEQPTAQVEEQPQQPKSQSEPQRSESQHKQREEAVTETTKLDRTMGQRGSKGPEKPDYRDDKKVTDSMTGMKVAPRKISEREKLKKELEDGKKIGGQGGVI